MTWFLSSDTPRGYGGSIGRSSRERQGICIRIPSEPEKTAFDSTTAVAYTSPDILFHLVCEYHAVVQIQPTLESRRKEITLYAIIRDRGMQYRVQEGQILDIALTSDVAAGGELTVSEVLLVGGEQTVVGNPTVSGASVVLKVIGDVQGDKIVVFRYKSKKRYRRRTGHRQDLTRVQVVKIDVSGADDAKPKATRRKSAAA